jgi:hypothetical protein
MWPISGSCFLFCTHSLPTSGRMCLAVCVFLLQSMLRVRANFHVYWLNVSHTLCVVHPELDKVLSQIKYWVSLRCTVFCCVVNVPWTARKFSFSLYNVLLV